MNSLLKYSISAIACSLLVSCGSSTTTQNGSTDLPSSTATGTPFGASSPLYLQVKTNYEGQTAQTVQGSCSFTSTDPLGSTQTCNISVPNLDLWFSDLTFSMGSNGFDSNGLPLCSVIVFQPYYFVRSNAAAFPYDPRNPGTTVDCSGATTAPDPNCYGGSIWTFIPGFTTLGGLYFLPAVANTHDYTAKSTNSQYLGGVITGWDASNVSFVSNDLVDRTTPIVGSFTTPADYVGGKQFQDYKISCRDHEGDLYYGMTIIISTGDTSGQGQKANPYPWSWNWGVTNNNP